MGWARRKFDGRVAEDGHPYGYVVRNQLQHSYVRKEGIGRGTVRVPLPIQSFAAKRRADVVIGPYRVERNASGIRWAAVGGGPYNVVRWIFGNSYVRREGIGRGTVRVPLLIQSFAAKRRADVVIGPYNF